MAKTKFQIKNAYTDEVIVEMEAETLREIVGKNKANLQEADLRGADLREADLRGANLRGVDLWGVDLWGIKIKINQMKDLIKNLGIVVKDEK